MEKMLKANDLPQLLVDALPARAVEIRRLVDENTDDGQLSIYPLLGFVTDLVLQRMKSDAGVDRSELRALCDLAERALSHGDDRLDALFCLEFIDAFSRGAHRGVLVEDMLGPRSLARFRQTGPL